MAMQLGKMRNVRNVHRKIRKCNIYTAVFDGYNKLTKDDKHKARSFPLDRADFLANYTNKQSFVNFLVHKSNLHGFKVALP